MIDGDGTAAAGEVQGGLTEDAKRDSVVRLVFGGEPARYDGPDTSDLDVTLRDTLMRMTGRPVNIQASRDIVIALRGDLLDQPYLPLCETPDTLTLLDRADAS
jgi:hypothetical protein